MKGFDQLVERLDGLAYYHTAPDDGVGRNTYGDAARAIRHLRAALKARAGGGQ